MSNHHNAVGSKKTKNYEIIRSHQAFTFGTVPLDHTVGHVGSINNTAVDNTTCR